MDSSRCRALAVDVLLDEEGHKGNSMVNTTISSANCVKIQDLV